MSAAKPPSPTLFLRAAELRVRGSSWDAIAKDVGRAEKTVREWVRTYPREWRKAVRDAEGQVAQEATAESVLTLRRQLRSDDEKTSREAAAALIKFAALKQKPRTRAKPTRGPKVPPPVAALAEFVGGLTDEEVTTLLRELRRVPPADGTDAGPATPDRGEPARAE
ncbi:hypothetical protein [Limnoglobus roseus]|uniref:Uncharacterized protein n=1 Tax=Limnoglobus roseus TaxID=2598579 RepID=A0A5C1AC82_9BACT|nr:hypothetical protein [Limnoglobus roseus]QEL15807.1 hypothetical protein PX52LOC_02743 [Limnoglobus roseus]